MAWKRTWCTAAGAILMGFGAAGCTVLRTDVGEPLPPALTASIGVTRHADAMAVLGPPHLITALGDGVAFLYEQVAIEELQAGLSIQISSVPLLKAVVGRSGVDRQAVVLLFDGEGMLQAYRLRRWDDSLGLGGSVQWIASFLSVVDADDLDAPSSVHDWGGLLLEPSLPRGLNQAHSLETGQQGIEQRGTPNGVGQHALEYR